MQTFNFTEGLQSVSETWKKTNPAEMGSTPTSEVSTMEFTGSFDYLKNTLAPQFLEQGSAECQVNCSITRMAGGVGRLVVTKTFYNPIVVPDDPDDPDSPGGGSTAGSAGSSASNPIYEIEIGERQLPILVHPLVKAQGYDPKSAAWIALKMLSNGSDENETFTIGAGTDLVAYTVGEALEHVPSGVVALVSGQSSFLDVAVTLTVKWELDAAAAAPNVGEFMKIATPEGAPPLSGDRNWLLAGGGVTIEGDRAMMVKKYIASEPGGWKEEAYS